MEQPVWSQCSVLEASGALGRLIPRPGARCPDAEFMGISGQRPKANPGVGGHRATCQTRPGSGSFSSLQHLQTRGRAAGEGQLLPAPTAGADP